MALREEPGVYPLCPSCPWLLAEQLPGMILLKGFSAGLYVPGRKSKSH